MQKVTVGHDTPVSLGVKPAGGGGLVWVQDVAFQDSARGPAPTAVQTVTSTHETADRSATLLPSEAFVGVTIQVEPFHCSAPVPTAMQTFGDGHETPASSLDSPLVLSACWMTHFAPFQRSTRVAPPAVPTAVQTLA